MGEKTHLPSANNSPNQNADNSPMDEEEDDEFEDMTSEEFQLLDSQLDALNSALDDIEEKNDNIHTRLLQLLQSNREIRKQIQENNAAAAAQQSSQQQG